MPNRRTATFQEALDVVESLPEDQQDDLVDIIHRRRIERKRELLAKSIKKARAEYGKGKVTRGSLDDLMKELTE